MEHEDEDEEDLDEADVKKAKRCYDQKLEEDDEAPVVVPPIAVPLPQGTQSAGKGVTVDSHDDEVDEDEDEDDDDGNADDEEEDGDVGQKKSERKGGGASSVAAASSPAPFDLGPIGTHFLLR